MSATGKMAEKNQPAVNQWNSTWTYPYYSMYSNMGFNGQGHANMQQYYQNAYAGYQFNVMNSQMYQNTLMQQQQQYMRNFLPGGKLDAVKDEKSEEKPKEESEVKNIDIKEDLPPLPPGSPPKVPPPPEINTVPKINPVKFNIAGKNNVISPPKPMNAFLMLTAMQKKRKRNKMNKKLKKLQAESLKPDAPPTPELPFHPFNNFSSIPIPPIKSPLPSCDIAKNISPCNTEQENKISNITLNTDSFAKINKVKSTMDMSEWPQSLTEYVNRCYSKCKTAEEKDQMSEKLKTKILQAASSELLWVKEWDKEPMPLLESEISAMPQTPVCKGVYRGGRNIFTRPSDKKNRNHISYTRFSPHPSNQQNDNDSDSPTKFSKNKSNADGSWNKKQKRKSEESEDYIPIKNDNDIGRNSNVVKTKNNKIKKYSLGANIHEDSSGILMDTAKMEKRAARFSLSGKETNEDTRMNTVKSLSLVWNSTLSISEDRTPDPATEHIVGTCQDIEKQYLRLTSALEASSIRPPDVLKQSLARVKDRWLTTQDYHYACEQLKSIRQDLTVQGIRDKLTVDVYETHARIALEKGDHYEFNQCQSQLKLLYKEVGETATHNSFEFTCYRILYYIFTKDTTDLIKTIVELGPEERNDACVSFALKLSSACTLNNYKMFFKLYKEAPRMASYLIDLFVPRMRKTAVTAMIKAYRPYLPVSYVKQILGFECDTQCTTFLKEMEVIFADNEMSKIDCKATCAKLPAPARPGQ